MKTIDQLIQEKRQQVERLNAQLEVLEELATEARGSTPRGGRRPSRPSSAGRRRGRAGRGANQQRVLKVLSATPMRARDIAAAAKLPAPAANQVLMGLKKSGAVEQAGRGLYRLAEKPSAVAASKRPTGRKKGARRRTSRNGRGSRTTAKAGKKTSPAQPSGAPTTSEK